MENTENMPSRLVPVELYGEQQFKFEVGDRTYYVKKETHDRLTAEFEEKKNFALMLLHRKGGYLHADDRTRLHYLANSSLEDLIIDARLNTRNVEMRDLKSMAGRARNMVEAGVPPVFTIDFENTKVSEAEDGFTYPHYPTVDGVINLFTREFIPTGNYRLGKRTSAKQVKFFRDHALREDCVPRVRAELERRVSDIYEQSFESSESRAYVLNSVGKAFDHLATSLEDMPQGEVELKSEPGNSLRDTVAVPFWYTQFTPEAVKQIIPAYWDSFVNDFMEAKDLFSERFARKRPEFLMMSDVFPENRPDTELLDRTKLMNILTRTRITADYSSLTPEVISSLTDSQRGILRDYIADTMRTKLSPGDYSSRHTARVCKNLGIPVSDESKELVGGMVEDVLYERVSSMDNEEVMSFLNELRGVASFEHMPRVLKCLSGAVYGIVGDVEHFYTGRGVRTDFGKKAREVGFSKQALPRAKALYLEAQQVKDKIKEVKESHYERTRRNWRPW